MELKAYVGYISFNETIPSWTIVASEDYSERALNTYTRILIRHGYDPEKQKWFRKPKSGMYQDYDYKIPIPIFLIIKEYKHAN